MDWDLPAGRVLVATVLVNLGLACIVGAWASLLWLHGATTPWARLTRARCRTALTLGVAATLIFDVVLLWMQAAAMAEVPLPGALAMLPSVAWHTYAGQAWAGGMAALLIVMLGARGPAHQRRVGVHLALVAIGVSLFVYSRAAASHAGAHGLASVAVLVECLHLWAISVWTGAVGMAAFVVLDGAAAPGTADWIGRLSSAATAALAVIVGTGLVNAWRGVGAPGNLLYSVYGNVLLVKLACVAAAIALGAFNRLRVMPTLLAALRAPSGLSLRPQQRFVRVLRAEALVLLAALIAAALLSASPSPTAT